LRGLPSINAEDVTAKLIQLWAMPDTSELPRIWWCPAGIGTFFSCHAFQHIDPSRSGFVLQDSLLTMADLVGFRQVVASMFSMRDDVAFIHVGP
jgi:hypothetical protein